MKILVPVKAVPMETEVSMTAEKNIDREKTTLNLNISDEAALEAALGLVKSKTGPKPAGSPGNVCVLSMGTMAVKPILTELISRGADDALLISDKAFAGSDTYATARALLAAVPEDTDYIFCGRRAMDGETGQVPSMLAAGLSWPVVTNVLEVKHFTEAERGENGAVSLLARRMTEDGEETLLVPPRTVLSFCEYSYRLRLPGILGKRRALHAEIPVLDHEALGLLEEACGLKGSLTRVREVRQFSQHLRKGPRTDDTKEAAAVIAKMIREAEAGYQDAEGMEKRSLSDVPAGTPRAQRALVLVSEDADRGLIARALTLAKSVEVLQLSDTPDDAAAANAVFSYLTENADASAPKKPLPDMILAEASVKLRSVMPYLAMKLHAGLTADCTEISLTEEGRLLQVRPAFGNRLMASIETLSPVQMATVRRNAYPEKEGDSAVSEALGKAKILSPEADPAVQRISREKSTSVRLNEAKVIFAGGAGIGTPEDFHYFQESVEKAGFSTGATRKAVEEGFVTYPHQVGQTGVIVAPKLYIAFGISGAVQHLLGMRQAEKIVAVNTDPKAPIFDVADYGVYGDWKNVLKGILQEL